MFLTQAGYLREEGIAAFAPDKGESVSTLIADPPPGAPVPPIPPSAQRAMAERIGA